MKTIKYTGPHDAVELEHPVGRMTTVKRNQEISVPDRMATQLVAQDTWALQPKSKGEPDAS